VESTGHGDYTSPATHGPLFFSFLRGDGGSLDCASCHGATYDGGVGPSCNACHLSNGWTASWKTNCSFCHGTRNASTKTTSYSVLTSPTLSAPPDALSQRLTGTAAPSRTGAHVAHLTGKGSTSGATYAAAVPCASCHTVPADYAHAGGPGRAPVTLKGTGGLPASLGTYVQASGTCTTYCHGSTLVNDLGATAPPPAWTGTELGCTGCHGNPPVSGQHDLHVNQLGWWCADCHTGAINYSNVIGPRHLDGTRDVVFFSPGSTWDGAFCTSACHESGETRSWH
jgi:predicted CxxxxCH...CXXCH cytochrome family protein